MSLVCVLYGAHSERKITDFFGFGAFFSGKKALFADKRWLAENAKAHLSEFSPR